MENIRPSSDLRNRYGEISALCKETSEPVFITVHGKGDTAILEIGAYQKMQRELELYKMLALSDEQFGKGETLCADDAFESVLKTLEDNRA